MLSMFLATVVAASSLGTAAAAVPSPAPTADSHAEIGRIRANPYYCTVLRNRIGPSLQGLMKNDDAIAAGHRALSKMGADTLNHSEGSLDMDRKYLGEVVMIASRNILTIKRLLNDPVFTTPTGNAANDRTLAAAKANLQSVAAAQDDALNLIDGTLETDLMGQMQAQKDQQMANAVAGPTPGPQASAVPEGQYIANAGLADTSPSGVNSPVKLASGTLTGRTIYDSLGLVLGVDQQHIAAVESNATKAVLKVVPLCSSPNASASAAPDGGPAPAEPETVPVPQPTSTPPLIHYPN